MCGIAGFFSGRPTPVEALASAAGVMADRLAHRGPDDRGTWAEAEAGIALGFRRLSIIDLSDGGHQPMVSASGKSIIVFNGEVYNFAELRKELEAAGIRFRGRSDSEVVVEALERWGVEAALPRLMGMFAFALWDVKKRRLVLVRDRLGIKPLYVYHQAGLVSFGSELKALAAGPSFDHSLDTDSVAEFLRYLYVPAPKTIFARVTKLLPGHFLTVEDPNAPLPEPKPYWSLADVARENAGNPIVGSEREILDEFDRLLTDAVATRLNADVPLGALLSGGIDSSAVVALAQKMSDGPIKTFTIGFDDPAHNEADHARGVAEHLGTDHRELLVTGQDALAVVPRLAEMFDEPLANPSQIPTYLVSSLARQEVTVALSGDGGDELFGGYNRYTSGQGLLSTMDRMPRWSRRLAAGALSAVPPATWSRLYNGVAGPLGRAGRHRLVGEKLLKVGNLLKLDTFPDRYRSLLSAWQDPTTLLAGTSARSTILDRTLMSRPADSYLDRMMLADQLTYLPDDLLAKVDRASMAVGLEVRVPILDHRVVELSWRLPSHFKIREGAAKWVLREIAFRHIPKTLLDRPKTGFTVPIDAWLNGPLHDWANDLIRSDSAVVEVLDRQRLGLEWDRYQETGHGGLAFWAVLMLQSWLPQWATVGGQEIAQS